MSIWQKQKQPCKPFPRWTFFCKRMYASLLWFCVLDAYIFLAWYALRLRRHSHYFARTCLENIPVKSCFPSTNLAFIPHKMRNHFMLSTKLTKLACQVDEVGTPSRRSWHAKSKKLAIVVLPLVNMLFPTESVKLHFQPVQVLFVALFRYGIM